MVLIICTKNESNLTNRYWDMDPDGRTEWTDGRRQNYIPPTSSGDNKGADQTARMQGSSAPLLFANPWRQVFSRRGAIKGSL